MNTDFFTKKRFVAMMACLTGMAAMGIDSVLPAFPAILDFFAMPTAEHNRIHQVVFVFMLGFATLQLLFGILADAFGRKCVLISGLIIYIVASASVIFVTSFEQLLVARFIQGAGLAAPRVLTMTIVRDRTSGAAMSRIMSIVMMVFLAIPIIAPIVGQLVILVLPWQGIFFLLMLFGIGLLTWVRLELPETLPAEKRLPLNIAKLKRAGKIFLSSHNTQVYLVMISLLFGMLMTYVGLAEPILQTHIYQQGKLFPLLFGLVVTGMLVASLINTRFVMKAGMEKMVILALGILLITDSTLCFTVIAGEGVIPLWLFILLLILHFLGFGLAMPNLNALAMQPYQDIAGTASALIGTITTILGVLIAQLISAFFDKTTLYSMGIGYIICTLCVCTLGVYLAKQPAQDT